MPIEGLPSSDQREAFGASGGILSTGFERLFGKNKKDTPVSLEPEVKFKNFLIEMIESQGLSEVAEKRERKPLEEELLYQQELARISEKRLDSVTKTRKKEKKAKKQERKAKEEELEAAGTGPSAQFMSSSERVKAIEELMLKDYVAMTAKKLVGMPRESIDSVNLRLVELQNLLIEQGLSPSDFSYLDQKTLELIKESFLLLIKDRFFKSPESSMGMIDWILTAKTGKSVIEMLSLLEKDTISLSEKARLISAFEISDLLEISAKLNLDISSWMAALQKEKISIENIGGVELYFHAIEQNPLKEAANIVDMYRMSQTDIFLESSVVRRMRLVFESRKLRKKLMAHGIDRPAVEEIQLQARKIAWIRTVSHLKENHLVRILTTSSDEFDKASKKIEKLTDKAKKLGYDIPKEGVKWIETGLTKLAHETALYKLELLRSLQMISFDPKRENDISRLSKIIADLNRKLAAK